MMFLHFLLLAFGGPSLILRWTHYLPLVFGGIVDFSYLHAFLYTKRMSYKAFYLDFLIVCILIWQFYIAAECVVPDLALKGLETSFFLQEPSSHAVRKLRLSCWREMHLKRLWRERLHMEETPAFWDFLAGERCQPSSHGAEETQSTHRIKFVIHCCKPLSFGERCWVI